MKKTALLLFIATLSTASFAQLVDDYQLQIDSIEKTFQYQHGTVSLQNGVGQLEIPAGFKYLDPTQAERVLVDLWGNPKGENLTLGMLLPDSQGVMSDNGYAFNIQYDEIGYVNDEDADEIDYDELLTTMQKETEEGNEARTKEGYEPITIVGWAAKPFYDKDKKILHWAKEIRFGSSTENTLNYNIRVLGRKGVLVLNAIATMPNLDLVQHDIPQVLDVVKFNDGYKYEQYDASVDKIAAWTIGGLVAGKVLAKVGFFAILLKFWKLIGLAIIGFGTMLWKKIRGSKETEETQENDAVPALNTAPSETEPQPKDDHTETT